jgi:hypothetical protein
MKQFIRVSKNPIAWMFSIGYILSLIFLPEHSDGFLVMAVTPFVDLGGACAKIVRQMEDLTKQNTPFNLGRKTGIIDALLDPSNGGIKLDLNNTQAGKKFVKTKVHYKVRFKPCEWLTDASVPSICNEGSEPLELSVDATISKQFSSPVRSFTNADMVNVCQDTQSFIRDYLMSDMRAGREKLAEYLLAQADGYIGRARHQNGDADNIAGGHKTKRLLATSTETGAVTPLYANYADILLDYQLAQLGGAPMLVGDGILQKFFMLSKYSAANAPGVAYDSAIAEAGAAFYLDQAASTILGSNKFLSIAPNTLHLLSFNKNANINIESATRSRTVVQDPVYPALKWDLDFEFTCDDVWSYKLSVWADMFSAIRTDAFGTDYSPQNACEDELAGMTGVFGFVATSA